MSCAFSSPEASETEQDYETSNAPNFCICPISGVVMKHAVIGSDGHSYDLVAYQECIAENNTSPTDGSILKSKTYFPNHRLQAIINKWLQQKKMAKQLL